MAERRRIDLYRELDLILSADVPGELKSAMMNEVTRELNESAERNRQEAERLSVGVSDEGRPRGTLGKAIRANEALRRARADELGDDTIQAARVLLQRLRRGAGLLPRIERATPGAVSDPIPARSEAAALFSLIHDAGGRMPDGGNHG